MSFHSLSYDSEETVGRSEYYTKLTTDNLKMRQKMKSNIWERHALLLYNVFQVPVLRCRQINISRNKSSVKNN